MWDLFEILASGLFELMEFFFGWRFYVAVFVALAVIALIYSTIDNRTACLALSIPIGLAGLVTGIAWQSREGW
jgi:hypothetical protein